MAKLEEVSTTNLSIDSIVTDKYTPRFRVDPSYIDELAESINIEGQIKPIVVRRNADNDTWELIDGEYRLRAMKKLGKATIRCEIVAVSDEEAKAKAVVYNLLHGKPLNWLEISQAVKGYADQGKSERQIAKIFGKSLGWVSHALSLTTKASEGVGVHAREHRLGATNVREITKLPKNQQDKVADAVVREGLSSRQTEGMVELVKQSPHDIDRITSLPKDRLQAELQDLTPVRTKEDFDVLGEAAEASAKSIQEEKGRCPKCGAPYSIDWEEGRIEWQ